MPKQEQQGGIADLILAVEAQLTAPTPVTFPAILERRFELDTRRVRSRRAASAILAGLVAYVLLVPFEMGLMPDAHPAILIGKLGLATPLCLAGALLIWRGVGQPWNNLLRLGTALTATLGMWLPTHFSRSESAPLCQAGVLLTVTFVNLLCESPFFVAAANTALAMSCYAWGMSTAGSATPAHAGYAVAVVGCTLAFSLVANYRGNKSERRAYLMMLRESLHVEALDDQNRELLELSQTDALTGAANRRFFDSELAASFEGDPAGRVAVLLIDVDHFKAYNDHYGHPAGDRCLATVAAIMQQQLRMDIDLLARYGGEEFAVILPNADMGDAAMIADRMRRAVEGLEIAHPNSPGWRHVTVSIGFSAAERGTSTPTTLVKAADAALYLAKQDGRNRVFPPLVSGAPRPPFANARHAGG